MATSLHPSVTPLAVSACTVTSALGQGKATHVEGMHTMQSGLHANDFSLTPLTCHIGRVEGLEHIELPGDHKMWDCRNNRLGWLALQQDGFRDAVVGARQRYGSERMAVLAGTSAGSIGSTEDGYRRLESGRLPEDIRWPSIHCLHSLGAFLAAALELTGPAMTVSTACSSSAKVFAMAERMIRCGLIDAAVVGGVESLCHSVLHGFNSLQLVSDEACRPFDVERNGISIGEGAGLALLERVESATGAPRLLGWGESSDAWHMTAPHPDGLGAELAIREALDNGGLDAGMVDYINLHGTGTRNNDAVEARLVDRMFPDSVRASSTKGYTGHTLGAAGAVEAVLTLLALQQDLVPGNLGCRTPEVACARHLALETRARHVCVALTNSFGFGGNNVCLAFAKGSATA
ncbi:MAG TPA: beta-ketoacyl-ACP synthase [Oleiagrimonas sp.]|nr:beta-ketoacyl-ACP synthase [Oleiagrimonas sp.]